MSTNHENIVAYIRELFRTSEFIPLHEPCFGGREKEYLNDCIDSTFVSSVGKYVDRFEKMTAEFTGAKFAVATVNGTAALHAAMVLAGVRPGDEVLTQAVTFVATANAIHNAGGEPVFLDSDPDRLGMSPEALAEFLSATAEIRDDGAAWNRNTGRKIAACVPVHIFGHPVRLDEILKICADWRIPMVEDAAEALGSYYKGRHAGTFGRLGTLSYNGNKTITTGGGGMILTDDEELGRLAKHITTTAKQPHRYEYFHDRFGFNYRLPNINAALGCAQMEMLPRFIENKRKLAAAYKEFFRAEGIRFVSEPDDSRCNYWLNAIVLSDLEERNAFLDLSNDRGVMTRPLWALMPDLPMYRNCQTGPLDQARRLYDRVVNIPSSVKV